MTLEIPFIGMMVLTMIVWMHMYWRRLRFIHRNRIDPQLYATRVDGAVMPAELRKSSDNLQNLFELPLIFYVLVIYLVWENQAGYWDIVFAYIFVIGRVAHSIIHCSYNRVTHRFAAYFISALALWLMVLRVVWGWVVY